jgi:hypothetical protein
VEGNAGTGGILWSGGGDDEKAWHRHKYGMK